MWAEGCFKAQRKRSKVMKRISIRQRSVLAARRKPVP